MTSPGGSRQEIVRASLEYPNGLLPGFSDGSSGPPAAEASALAFADANTMVGAEALTQPLLSAVDDDAAAAAADAAESGQPLLVEKDDPVVRDEAHKLLKLALPMMLQSLALMLLTFVSTTFVGHLNDPLALSAVVLSSSLYNVSGISMTLGLASAMDTLCGQAFGARQYAVLGEVLQRARVICWTICLPIALLWWFMEPVLLLLGQQPDLAHLAAVNMRILVPSLFLGVVTDTTRRYLVTQRAPLPASCCYMTTTLLSPLFNYLFIFKFNLRAAGAAWALNCCTLTNATLLTLYQLYRDKVMLAGKPESTWRGYSLAAFRGWRQYLSLGVPAAAMICLEWWVWELMIFMAGLLPNAATAVGVMGLCIQITNPSYMIPSSFGSATSVRVANLLGAGLPVKARTAARVSACIVLLSTLLLGTCTFLARHWVVRVFTEDVGIRAATAAVVPAVATSIVGDGMVAVLSGVLRASGRQATGAVMNIAGYWAVCLPLAWFLGFRVNLGVLGFWLALTFSTALQASAFGILISRFDWAKEVQRAATMLSRAQRSRESSSQ